MKQSKHIVIFNALSHLLGLFAPQNVINCGGMAAEVLSTTPRDPPSQPPPAHSVMIIRMRMKKQIKR